MAVTQTFSRQYFSAAHVLQDAEKMIQLGSRAVFRTRPVAIAPHILEYVDRRDRAVLLLLDGRRALKDVARLTHRSELEVAQVLVRFLKRGYIEFLGSSSLAGQV